MNEQQKVSLVSGGLLIVLGGLLLLQSMLIFSAWVWVAAFGLCGLAVLAVYLTDRSQWWMLIVAYVLLALAGLIAGVQSNFLQDAVIAFYVLSAVGLPFLYVFLRNRQNWWALIPAYTLFAVGLMVALIESGILNDLLIPVYVMFAIAIPFFVVYANNQLNWWALIPAGVLSLIGVGFLLFDDAVKFVLPVLLILAGGYVLLRQFRHSGMQEKESIIPGTEEDNEKSSEV